MLVKADGAGKRECAQDGDRSDVIAIHTGTICYMCFEVLKKSLSPLEDVQKFFSFKG